MYFSIIILVLVGITTGRTALISKKDRGESDQQRSKRNPDLDLPFVQELGHGKEPMKRIAFPPPASTLSELTEGGICDISDDMAYYHNGFRSIEAMLEKTGDMFKLETDYNLRDFADDLVTTCSLPLQTSAIHRTNLLGSAYSYIGEVTQYVPEVNGNLTLHDIVEIWYNQKDLYNPDTDTCEDPLNCERFLQVVWASTKFIGCKLNYCPTLTIDFGFPIGIIDLELGAFYAVVCNYGEGGPVTGNALAPYVTMDCPCAVCTFPPPDYCSMHEGLCEHSV